MNKFLTVIAMAFMATSYASDGIVTVNKSRGTYVVGAPRGSINCSNFTLPISESALKQGTDHNKPIPTRKPRNWNGN
jgi:hypothetical protein